MRVLILEDEPIIAIDLEDIVTDRIGAECVTADNVEDGMRCIEAGIDFAILDINLGDAKETSLPVAARLLEKRIPFCFVSSSLERLPPELLRVPRVAKPFQPKEIARVLPMAA